MVPYPWGLLEKTITQELQEWDRSKDTGNIALESHKRGTESGLKDEKVGMKSSQSYLNCEG